MKTSGNTELWTVGQLRDAQTLNMQGDGNLVLRNSSRKSLWSSKTYGNQGAFLRIKDDATAVIELNGKILWSIKGESSDLCPDDPDKEEPGTCGCGIPEGTCGYEAEDCTNKYGCNLAKHHSGFTGTGFVDFGGAGTWIEWNNIIIKQTGDHTLTLRYANGSSSTRQCSILVDGTAVGTVSFPSTGGWESYKTDTVTISLSEGTRVIRILASTSKGGPNLDNMKIDFDGPTIVDDCPDDPNKTEPGECGCGVPEGSCGQCNDTAGINFSAKDSYGAGAVRASHKKIDCGFGSSVEQDNGPPQNRVNLILIGDGYTNAELQSTWPQHVDNALDIMFGPNTEPYRTYRKYINVCRLNVASQQSGVDHATGSWPPSTYNYTEYKNTALDGVCNVENRLGTVDEQKVTQKLDEILGGTGIDADWVGAVLNTDKWCNAGSRSATWAGYTLNLDVAYHESGHSWHGLADEYGGDCEYYSGTEPRAVNMTRTDGEKWSEWAGFDQAGIGLIDWYEGGLYCKKGVYRPSDKSKMKWVANPHNAVCMQKIVQDIYSLVRPIDAWTDNRSTIDNPCSIQIKLIDKTMVNTTWSIDGQMVTTSDVEKLTIEGRNLSKGNHQVSVRVEDKSLYVRAGRSDLAQTITWTIKI